MLSKENFIKNFELAVETEIPVYLAFLDLNSMKMVNDTFGHQAGDLVIDVVTGVLEQRTTLTIDYAKFGGDEFLISFVNKDQRDVEKFLIEVQKTLRNHTLLEPVGGISASVGVVKYEQQAHHGFKGCFKQADQLMYMAKKMPPHFLARSWDQPREKRELNTQGSRLRSFFEWITTTLVKEHPMTPFKLILQASRETFEQHDNILDYSPKVLFAIIVKKLENIEKTEVSK